MKIKLGDGKIYEVTNKQLLRYYERNGKMEQMKYAFENAKIITKGTTPNTYCRVDGMKVRMAREGRWTRKDLATIANVGTNLIEQMEETPTRTFKRDKVEQVAKAISLPVEQLIVYEGKRPRSPRGMRVAHNKKPIPFIKKAPTEVLSENPEKLFYAIDREKLSALILSKAKNLRTFCLEHGLDDSILSKILRGDTKFPRKVTVENIAEALNINVSDIVKREKFRADTYKPRKKKRKLFPGGYKKKNRLKNAPVGTFVEYRPVLKDPILSPAIWVVIGAAVMLGVCGVVHWL